MSDTTEPRPPSDEQLDAVVVAQADDDSAWDAPVRVTAAAPACLDLPAELAARAQFLARLHREASVENWLVGVIRDRVDLEEAAFAGLKRELAQQAT